MEALLETQSQLMQGMDNLLRNFKKDSHDRKTPDYIRRKLETLDAYWQEFQSNHVKLCDYDVKDNAYFIGNDYERTTIFYNQTRQIFQDYRSDTSRPTTPTLKPATTLQIPSQPGPSPMAPPRQSEGTNSKLDERLRKQISNFKAFDRTVANIEVDEMSDNWEFEDALTLLKARWGVIDSLHWEIDSDTNGDYQKYEEEFVKYEKLYVKIKKTLNTKMCSVSHREKSTPKMEIPTFNGNYQQWTSFKDLFQEAIHNNLSMSSAQKLQFLKGKLRGEAERLIQHLCISSENYQVSWDILNHRYNNKKLTFTSHLNSLLTIPNMQTQSLSLIKRLHDTTNESLHAIQKLGVDTTSWDPLIVHLLSQKLDVESHNEYIQSLQQPREIPTLQEFLSFLETKFMSLESFRHKPDSGISTRKDSQFKKPYHQNQHLTNSRFNKPYTQPSSFKTLHVEASRCPHCKKNHAIYLCKTFRKSTSEAKQKTVASNNLCKNCLTNHNGKQCISLKTCRFCNENHNSLIHDVFVSATDIASPSNSTKPAAVNDRKTCHVSQENVSEILLATAKVNVKAKDGTYHTMRALIDQGSQTSLISENAAQILGLPRRRCRGVIFGVGAKENSCKGVVNIEIQSLCNVFSVHTDAIIMTNLVSQLPNQTLNKPTWKYLDTIQLADPEFYQSRRIDILLGADIYSSIILSGIIKIGPSMPVAQETQFGWILCGKIKSFHCNVVINQTDELKKFWEIEDISQETVLSEVDDYCIKFYKSTTVRDKEGRYHVRLPLKPNFEEKLGSSRPIAVAQFRQLEKRFSKNKLIEQDYKSFMNEYRALGHMTPVASAAAAFPADSNNGTPDCFLPHHCVLRTESTTTALRVVFNASSNTSTGFSLNDLMEAGPNLQQDLQTLILKWRQYQYAFTADIEKMFRQIRILESDQRYQKIIWRDDPNKQLQTYQLTTVTYGTKSAPFLAMMTLKQLASDEKPNFVHSEAPKVIEESCYMDDVIQGTHSIPDGVALQSDLIKLLKSGGFNLRKWRSNVKELIPEPILNSQKHFDFKKTESTKTLGLRWEPQKDLFTFEHNINFSRSHHTKRSLLSDISQIFDPLGWLSPFTTKLKIIFQQVWQSKMEWDDTLPEHLNSEWMKVRADAHKMNLLQLPRWLGIRHQDSIELHGFCDASTKAYAAVIYCRIKRGDTASVVLVVGKARLVPVNKTISLPKLELCGAQLLSSLMRKVKDSYQNYTTEIYGWSDSMVVLGWLNGEPNRWKTFVANRVRQITEIMPSNCWKYIKSEENPADCASRGLNATQLHQHPLWWQGPAWLSSSKNYQNQESNPTYTTDKEIRKTNKNSSNVIIKSPDDNIIQYLITKHSSLSRVVRVVAWIMRLRNHINLPYLSTNELNDARRIIIKSVQMQEFANEIEKLKNCNQLDKRSSLHSLNPFIDQHGLLRVDGRLEHAFINEDMKHPYIIPHKHRLTELLINHAHNQTLHGGARLTLAFLRKAYWIIGGNRATKKQTRQCVKCKRNNPIKHQQLMGDLPAARSNPSRPFEKTGVDFTGSVPIKANKGRGIKTTKGYVAVFVCMATKAVHLELVSDLSTSSFLAALRRMAARRGTPLHIYSDNGTNFLGASRVLKNKSDEFNQVFNTEFMSEVSEMGINWHFNAPSWPTAGGLWEAAVKSLKYHIKRVIGEQRLTYEEFTTILTQIEACLNSRPLCPLTEDPDDLNYLTPSHFLCSGPTLTIVETEGDKRTRWQLTQKIFQGIWKRWQSEYLIQLSTRSKWSKVQENVRVKDVVIIHDSNLPAGKWALGRVLEIHPGKDGYVRVVTLKTKNGVIKRPITKISVLPVSNYQEENVPDKKSISTEKPKQTTSIKAQRSMTSYLTTMLCLLLFTPAQCTYNLLPLENNSSMYYFDQTAQMSLIRDQWKLVVYLDLSAYWQRANLLDKYISHLTNTCANNKIRPQCDIALLQLNQGYEEYNYYNRMLLGQHIPKPETSRRRRGLINGVGNIAHSLFGILDEDFAEQYSKDIDLIHANEKHLENLWRNQTSVIEAEYMLLKNEKYSVDKQYKIFNQHLNILEKATNELKSELQKVVTNNEFAMSTLIANNILTDLRKIQDMLLDAITDIYYGNFNVHLLKPEQLLQELHLIASRIPKDLSLPITDIYHQLPKLYHLLKVKARITKEYSLFEIRIPLISRDLFDIYKIIPIPREVNNHMVTLLPIASHVAINLQKDLYLPVSDNSLHACMSYDTDVYLCPLNSLLYQFKSDQSLCIKDLNTQTCKIKTNPCEHSWFQLHKMNSYLYVCCGECTVRIICEQLITAKRLTKAGVITLGNGCILKGDSITITAHRQFDNSIELQLAPITPEIPPINNIINVNIPHSTIEIESNGLEKELKEVGDQIKEMKNKDGVADVISYHDVHHYTVIYLLVGIIVVAGFVWAGHRVRARRHARRASLRNEVDATYSASVQCVSVKESIPSDSDKRQSVGENIKPESSSEPKVPNLSARVDKATMPCFSNHFS